MIQDNELKATQFKTKINAVFLAGLKLELRENTVKEQEKVQKATTTGIKCSSVFNCSRKLTKSLFNP